MKIVIPFMGLGKTGGYKVLSNLANCWAERGHEVHVLLYEKSFSGHPYFHLSCILDIVDKKGRIVRSLDASQLDTSSDGPVASHSRFERLVALTRGLRKEYASFDVVLANENLTAYCAVLSKCQNRFYYIQAYECLYEKTSMRGLILNAMARGSYRLPLTRIVNAELYRNYENIKSSHVIPPGMDLAIFAPSANAGNTAFTVGCIGRKEEWKGSEIVAKAVALLRDRGHDICFRVAFNPVLSCDNYELVQADGDYNLAQFYRGLDVLVAPGTLQLGSIHYPVIEAMACKVPVITTGYYPADNTNAYIVPVNDPESVAQAILRVRDNRAEATSKVEKGYEQIRQFSWETVSQEFIEIFEGGDFDGDHANKSKASV